MGGRNEKREGEKRGGERWRWLSLLGVMDMYVLYG